MQDVIDAFTSPSTVVKTANVALDESKPLPLRGSTSVFTSSRFRACRSRNYQPHYALIELEQRLQQIGADEAGDAGDQPAPRTPRKAAHASS